MPAPSGVGGERFATAVSVAGSRHAVVHAGYLALLPATSGQCEHALREVFNGLRYVVKTGIPWRSMPNDLPPWAVFCG